MINNYPIVNIYEKYTKKINFQAYINFKVHKNREEGGKVKMNKQGVEGGKFFLNK